MELTVGNKGGGGRVGFGNPSNKGPKNLGGSKGAGGRVTGGGTRAALARIDAGGGSPISVANFAREAGLDGADALTEIDRLVDAAEAEYTFLSPSAAAILRGNGQAVPERDGRPVRGFRMTGSVA
jgi:hypothetical protein